MLGRFWKQIKVLILIGMRAEPIELMTEEMVISDVGASLVHRFTASYGRLVVTNHRLHYLPMYGHFVLPLWKPTVIKWSEVAGLENLPWKANFVRLPKVGPLAIWPAVRLRLCDGSTIDFHSPRKAVDAMLTVLARDGEVD